MQTAEVKTLQDLEQQPDLSTVSWRFEAWIREFPLNRNTVLDYFKHSPFYDRTCNNELILQQGADISKLRTLTGIEYEVDSDPSKHEFYFLLRKQFRDGPSSVRALGLFYVVGISPQSGGGPEKGTVFPMPDMHSVFACNLTTAMFYLNSAFKELSEAVRFKPARPYTWEFRDANAASGSATISTNATATAAGASTPTAGSGSGSRPAPPARHNYSGLVDEVMHKLMRGDV